MAAKKWVEKQQLPNSKLIHTFLGNILVKHFLKSKTCQIVSEQDFLLRLKLLTSSFLLIFFYIVVFAFFLYFKFSTTSDYNLMVSLEAASFQPQMRVLLDAQIQILDIFIIICGYHLGLIIFMQIIMLNMRMGKGVTAFYYIFSILYVAEWIFMSSILFVLERIGLVGKIGEIDFMQILKTQWLWFLPFIINFFSFLPFTPMYFSIKEWYREWVRVDLYRKTDDKENGFIFRNWVTEKEIYARNLLWAIGQLLIFTASEFEVVKFWTSLDLSVFAYLTLSLGIIIVIATIVLPYNRYALIFFIGLVVALLVLQSFGLYLIQKNVYLNVFANFPYLIFVFYTIAFLMSISALNKFAWSLRDAKEIKAIVIQPFSSNADFEDYVEEFQQNKTNIEQEEKYDI